jgi:hypothetical protein
LIRWLPTTRVARALGSVTPLEANWSRSKFLLGHVSIQTTERYLGCKQRIRSAVNERIGIELRPIPDQGRFADHPEGGQTSQYERVRQE